MELQELVNLISIRQYVVNATANPAIDRETVNFLTGALLLLDKKILAILQDTEFKEYINYADVMKAKIEAARITNVKSSLLKK